MRLRMWLIAVITVMLVAFAQAQYRNTPTAGDPSEYLRGQSDIGFKAFRGLLDPSRMHMSHSVSFGYASMGGRGVSQGLYLNRIDYRISQPLWITTHLGYRFQPSGPAEWNPANNGTDFVGGAELNWKPTSGTSLHLSFYRGMYPDSYYGYYGWRPYDYRPWFNRP